MSCNRIRARLDRGAATDAAARRHLAGCGPCAEYARRLEAARRALRDRHAGVTPDPGFAARVTARIGRSPDALAWALARLMPAGLALVVVLSAYCLWSTPSPGELARELPAEQDVLAWALADGEPGR